MKVRCEGADVGLVKAAKTRQNNGKIRRQGAPNELRHENKLASRSPIGGIVMALGFRLDEFLGGLLDSRKIAAAVALLLLGGQAAQACGSGKILFQDKFTAIDPRWNLDAVDATRSVGADGLTKTLNAGDFILPLSQAGLYDNYQLCATMTMKYPDDKSGSFIGIIFWADDIYNRYQFTFSSLDGTYSVGRIQKDKVLTQIPWGAPSPAVHKESGVENEVSVTVNGNHAVFAINDQKVAELDGQPPDGGGLIGFVLKAEKQDSGPTVFGVKDIEVRALQ
jgi:hypothetical protein